MAAPTKKGHPPKTPLEKGMVALMKRNDLKSISATPNAKSNAKKPSK